MSLIQQYVTEETVIRIEGEEGARNLMINDQMNPQVEGFNDLSAGEFDMIMDETVETSSTRMATSFRYLLSLPIIIPDSIPPDIMR